MALPIKFGTDGWRAMIAKEFTVENVARVAQGTATWVVKEGLPQVAVVGTIAVLEDRFSRKR